MVYGLGFWVWGAGFVFQVRGLSIWDLGLKDREFKV